jgi:hypothetical protein
MKVRRKVKPKKCRQRTLLIFLPLQIWQLKSFGQMKNYPTNSAVHASRQKIYRVSGKKKWLKTITDHMV